MVALLGHAYAGASRRSEAEAILQQLSALSKQKYVPPYPIAAIYAELGQKDEAFAWLERAYKTRSKIRRPALRPPVPQPAPPHEPCPVVCRLGWRLFCV